VIDGAAPCTAAAAAHGRFPFSAVRRIYATDCRHIKVSVWAQLGQKGCGLTRDRVSYGTPKYRHRRDDIHNILARVTPTYGQPLTNHVQCNRTQEITWQCWYFRRFLSWSITPKASSAMAKQRTHLTLSTRADESRPVSSSGYRSGYIGV